MQRIVAAQPGHPWADRSKFPGLARPPAVTTHSTVTNKLPHFSWTSEFLDAYSFQYQMDLINALFQAAVSFRFLVTVSFPLFLLSWIHGTAFREQLLRVNQTPGMVHLSSYLNRSLLSDLSNSQCSEIAFGTVPFDSDCFPFWIPSLPSYVLPFPYFRTLRYKFYFVATLFPNILGQRCEIFHSLAI